MPRDRKSELFTLVTTYDPATSMFWLCHGNKGAANCKWVRRFVLSEHDEATIQSLACGKVSNEASAMLFRYGEAGWLFVISRQHCVSASSSSYGESLSARSVLASEEAFRVSPSELPFSGL